jgi:hypothetical protein
LKLTEEVVALKKALVDAQNRASLAEKILLKNVLKL